jgi:hypothetical protein
VSFIYPACIMDREAKVSRALYVSMCRGSVDCHVDFDQWAGDVATTSPSSTSLVSTILLDPPAYIHVGIAHHDLTPSERHSSLAGMQR